jgi:hypothetical protein
MIRVKYECTHIMHAHPSIPSSEVSCVSFAAAVDPENDNWSTSNLYSSMVINITNPDALEAFVVGKFYYMDFSDAPEPVPVTLPEPVPEPAPIRASMETLAAPTPSFPPAPVAKEEPKSPAKVEAQPDVGTSDKKSK